MNAATKPAAATPFQTVLSWFPIRDFFSLDLRSLALLRICLGVMLLQEWVNRLFDTRMLFSDEGVVPREITPPSAPISIFLLSGSVWYPATLMSIGIVLAVLLLVGWRTQFVTFLSWFLLIGIQGRDFAVMQGGDVVMRMALFWGLFLPLGACYSLDALREPLREWRPRVLTVGSVAYIVQMCLIYWFAAAWKTDAAWRTDRTAVYMALSLDSFATPFAHWLLQFPPLLQFLTTGALILEMFGPALLFSPFANSQVRLGVILAFISFHTGLILTMELGNFPPICIVVWLALLPTWFWDRAEARLRSLRRSGMVVYYDDDNAWHRRCVEAVRMFLLLYETKMIPAEKDSNRWHRVRAAGPWLVVDADGKEWLQYAALVQMVQVSFLYWPLAYVLNWGPILRLGDKLLRWLAARRWEPAGEAAVLPDYPGARLGGWAQNTIVVLFMAYLIVWNIRSLDFSPRFDPKRGDTPVHAYFPGQLNGLAYALGLDQSWGLFAPRPGNTDGWYVVPAILKNGKIVDLYTDGGELTDKKPPLISATYSNTRTRKLLMNLTGPQFAHLLPYYARYLRNTWNEKHSEDEHVKEMFIIFMFKGTFADRQVRDDEIYEYRLFVWPYGPQPELRDPVTGEPYPLKNFDKAAPALGTVAGPMGVEIWNIHYNRPLMPELLRMKDGK